MRYRKLLYWVACSAAFIPALYGDALQDLQNSLNTLNQSLRALITRLNVPKRPLATTAYALNQQKLIDAIDWLWKKSEQTIEPYLTKVFASYEIEYSEGKTESISEESFDIEYEDEGPQDIEFIPDEPLAEPLAGPLDQLPSAVEFIDITVNKLVGSKQAQLMLRNSLVSATTGNLADLSWLVALLISEALKQTHSTGIFLDWCTCMPASKRITLIIQVLQSIKKQFPNRAQRLRYTSLGSGGLLQDYLMITALIRAGGYRDLHITIIDLDYPDIPSIPKTYKKRIEILDNIHRLFKQHEVAAASDAELLDHFNLLLAQQISAQEQQNPLYKGVLQSSIYNNAFDYLERLAKNPSDKAQVLVMADPGLGTFAINYPSQANTLALNIQKISKQFKAPFYVFLPRHAGAQFYSLPANKEPLASKKKGIAALLKKTKVYQYFTPTFLPQLRALDAQKKWNLLPLDKPATKMSRTEQIIVKNTWRAEPHSTFQDLVWNSLAPNGVVWQLYHTDLTKEKADTSKIIAVDISKYKYQDVLTPNIGVYLANRDYKKVPIS